MNTQSLRSTMLIYPLLCLFSQVDAAACLNDFGTGKNKKPVPLDTRAVTGNALEEEIKSLTAKSDWEGYERHLRALSAEKPNDFKVQSDLAVALLHLGKTKEPLEILKTLQEKYPTEYALAANLGTAYELNGELEKALQFIRKGIELNKNSHQGTEWLHERILEAKILMAANPNHLKNHSVLGLDFGKGSMIQKPRSFKLTPEQMSQTFTALRYQLRERLQFVQPPDPIVADLLFDFGNVASLFLHADPQPFYAMSLKYGDLRAAEIGKRKPKTSPKSGKTKSK